MNIGIACGGTGGHILPGLVTGLELRARGHHVTLWLSGRNVESEMLSGWDGDTVLVRSAGFSAGFSLKSVSTLFRLASAVRKSRRIMKEQRPDVMLGMGSYSSVGPVTAAAGFNVPVVLHEANVIPGRAITFLARHASAVAVAFSQAAEHIGHSRVVQTGLPLRKKSSEVFGPDEIDPERFTILVMGGSQGAHFLNDVCSSVIGMLKGREKDIQVIHLAGGQDREFVEKRYAESGVKALVFDFLKEMGKAYNAADLAVSRSGAASCMELAMYGVPAFLVPLPSARRGHQEANANALAEHGGAEVIDQSGLTPDLLAEKIQGLYDDRAELRRMGDCMLKAAEPDAAGKLADLIESFFITT